MKQTLLEIVQAILSAMDSEEIDSISDTTESLQVALICKNVYYDIAVDMILPDKQTLTQLNASIDPTIPCVLSLPDTVSKVWNVRYNYGTSLAPDFRQMNLLTFEEFMLRQTGPASGDTTVAVQVITVPTGETYSFYYRNNADPSFYSTFDDKTLIFDSYDSTKESTLQKSKSMCNGSLISVFSLVDSFIPDLAAEQFPYYINKCKVRAFNELKQTQNQEAAAETRTQKIIQQKRKQRTEDIPAVLTHARYGRTGSLGMSNSIPRSLRNGS